MRTLVVSTIVSLDGYTAGPGGDVMALPMDHSFDELNAERMRAADTLLMGATTYRGMVGFWPNAFEMPDLTEPSREIAERYAAGIEIVVVSDSLTADDTGPWSDQTRIVPRSEARPAVTDLKADDGGDIVVYGSATLVQDLLAADLVDDLHTLVAPLVLGAGVPLFGEGTDVRLERRDLRTWDGSDNVLISYGVSRAGR